MTQNFLYKIILSKSQEGNESSGFIGFVEKSYLGSK